jgi:hypothetical protein
MLCASWEGKMPVSCAKCRYAQYEEDNLGIDTWVECIFTKEVIDKNLNEYESRRNSKCPLVEQKG